MSRPRTVLVLGGGRAGKRACPVACVGAIGGDEGGVAFIATVKPLDAERAARMARKAPGLSERLW